MQSDYANSDYSFWSGTKNFCNASTSFFLFVAGDGEILKSLNDAVYYLSFKSDDSNRLKGDWLSTFENLLYSDSSDFMKVPSLFSYSVLISLIAI